MGNTVIEVCGIKVLFADGDTQVQGSWRVRRPRVIDRYLCRFKNKSPEGCTLRTRSLLSLRREWMAHNLLHGLHIKRERTADVDFETDTGKAKAAAYFALAAVYKIVWRMLNKQTKSDYVQEQG